MNSGPIQLLSSSEDNSLQHTSSSSVSPLSVSARDVVVGSADIDKLTKLLHEPNSHVSHLSSQQHKVRLPLSKLKEISSPPHSAQPLYQLDEPTSITQAVTRKKEQNLLNKDFQGVLHILNSTNSGNPQSDIQRPHQLKSRYPHQQSVTHHRIPSVANKQNQGSHIVVSHHSSSHQLPTDTAASTPVMDSFSENELKQERHDLSSTVSKDTIDIGSDEEDSFHAQTCDNQELTLKKPRLFKSAKPDKTGSDIINLENESIEIKHVIERSGQVLKEVQWLQERAQTNWNLSECQIDQEQGSVSRKVSKFIQSLMAPEYLNTSEGTKYKKTDSLSSHLVKKARVRKDSHLEGGTEIPYYQNSKHNSINRNRQLTSTTNSVTLSEDTLTSFIKQSYGCPRRFPKPEMQVLYHYMMSGQLHMPLYVPHSQSHFSPSQNTRDMTCEENSVLAKELLKEEEEKEKKQVNEDKHEEDENEEEEENENEDEKENEEEEEEEEEDIDKRVKERISNQLTIQILPSIDIQDKKTNSSSSSPSVEYLNSDHHITNGIPIEDISQDVSSSVSPVVVLDGLPPSPMKQSDQHLHLPPYLQEGVKPHPQECTRMSSNEIEYKIQQHMEKQAHEWIQQELLARVMACVSEQQNSVSSSPSSYCSTSIDSKEDECHDEEIEDDDIAELIKRVLFQQALAVLKSRKDEGKGGGGSSKEDYSFSFESNVSSESTPCIPTPHPTPPPSPPHCTTTPTDSLSRDIPTPDHTPTYTSEEEEEDETLLKEEIFTPEQTSELMSESSTKPHIITTPTTTPIISNRYVTPKSQEEKLEDIQKCTQSLSESSTHSSSTPPTYPCLSTSTISTDNDISIGQSVLLHRPLPPRVQETKSVSEGEVPLSPGDARWKIHIPKEGTPKRGVHDKGIKNVRNKITIKAHPRKESSDSSSDTSKNLMPSLGEVRKTNKKNVKFERTHEDSFDRFLTKLSTSTPDSDSSTTVKDNTIEDDTLADVPSMSDISFTSLHSGGRYPNLAANTVNTFGTKFPVQLSKVLCDEPQGKGELQYHQDSLSPGEVRRSRYHEITRKSLVKGRSDNQDGGSSLSEGEVPKILRTRTRERISIAVDRGAKRKTQHPKELEVESDMVQSRSDTTGGILSENETRNGIDIIDISHRKDSALKDSATHHEDEITLGKDLPNTQSRQYTTENSIQERRPDVMIVQEKGHPHIQPTGLIRLSPLRQKPLALGRKETSSESGKAIQGKHLLITDNVHQLRQTERHLSPMLSTSQDDLNPITAASITLQETITNEQSTLNENGLLLHPQSTESVHDSSSEIYVKPKGPVVLINELVGNEQDDECSFTFSSLSIPLTD